MRYSMELRNKIYVKAMNFYHLQKVCAKNSAVSITKKPLDGTKKSAADALITASREQPKRAI